MVEVQGYSFTNQEWADAWMSLLRRPNTTAHGCRGGGRQTDRILVERDRLRRENIALRQQLAKLQETQAVEVNVHHHNHRLRNDLAHAHARIHELATLASQAIEHLSPGQTVQET